MDKEILYIFFEGKATPEQESSIRDWMEASEYNSKEFFRERKLFDATILLGHQDEVKTIVKKSFSTKIQLRELLKIAAVIAITLSVTLFTQYKKESKDLMAMNTVTVPAGQRVNLILPDGTNIWLNACTTIKYPAVFAKDKRRIILDGEAYFDVVHDKNKPFIVNTKKYSIEVLGTKFNVEAYSKKDVFETSLMEGSVKIFMNDNANKSIMLSPNTRAYLKDNKLVSAKIEDFDVYRWKEGLICFQNLDFNEIMDRLEKYFDINIVINNKNVEGNLFTGKFRQSDGIDYALRVLQKDISFDYMRNECNEVIYIN